MLDPIRLYLDEDANDHRLLIALRSRGLDVLTPLEAKLMGASDERQLAYATEAGYTILTYNVRDFAILHRDHLRAGHHHSRIIVSEQAPVGSVLARLLKLMSLRSAAEMRDWLEYLSTWR